MLQPVKLKSVPSFDGRFMLSAKCAINSVGCIGSCNRATPVTQLIHGFLVTGLLMTHANCRGGGKGGGGSPVG